MRYVEQSVQAKKEPKQEKKEPVIKAGQKGYDYSNLASAKKIPTQGGYK